MGPHRHSEKKKPCTTAGLSEENRAPCGRKTVKEHGPIRRRKRYLPAVDDALKLLKRC